MTLDELIIKITGETSSLHASTTSASKDVEKLGKNSVTQGGKVSKSFDDAGGHASKFGGVLSGIAMGVGLGLFSIAEEGLSKLTGVITNAGAAYEDAQTSEAQFATALKDQHIPAAKAADAAMQSNIAHFESLGFSADETRSSMALLLGQTHNLAGANTELSDAADLARLKGISLASAQNVIERAMEGSTAGLKKYGINVAKGSSQTQILADIEKAAGGQADAYAAGPAGRLAAAHQKVTEEMVKVGAITDQITTAVMPALADVFGNVVDAAGPLLTQLGDDMPGIIATVKGGIKGLVDTFGPLITDIGDAMPTVIGDLVTAFDGVSAILGPIIKTIGQDLPGAFKAVSDEITTVEGFISGLIPHFGSGGAGGAATGLGKDIDNLRTMFGTAFADIQVIVKGALGMLENFWKTFGGDITQYLQIVIGMWEGIFNGVVQVIQGIFDVFAGLFSGDWSKVWTGIKEIFGGIMTVIVSIFKAAINVLPLLLDAMGKVLGGIWSNIWHGLETAMKAILDGTIAYIKWDMGLPGQIISDAFKAIETVIGAAPGAIAKLAVGMFDGITAAFKGAINLIIRGWNNLKFGIPGFSVGPISYGGFQISPPKIPYLHSGGIVPGPAGSDVLAMLQAGERVTPAGKGGGGNTINLIVNNPTPEAASTSIQHELLKLASLGYVGG